MRKRIAFIIIFGVSTFLVKADAAFQKFEKSTFYSVMASGDIDAIDKQIDILENGSINEKEGYEGALLMKKANLVKKPKDKLSLFKKGRIKFETALLANNENVEFHFLRLAIEEHAPKIVKYHNDIEKDKMLIINNFKNLPPIVQNAILDYCKTSKVLHKEDL
ncbi:MAG: hypothetical protein JWQ63_2111 [Mucilaginibacter sp.]|jgi:hypothetical protein|nr:hypothetical protein [Mucilaginibacter sp.]